MKSILDKKGLSVIVATVILVALSMISVVIVWGVINNLVNDETEGSQACFEVLGKVSLEKKYTCYDSEDRDLEFSINVGNVDISGILVAVAVGGSGSGFEMVEEGSTITGLTMADTASSIIVSPGKNSGYTYILDLDAGGFSTGDPEMIQITPVVEGTPCEVSDTITEFGSCAP